MAFYGCNTLTNIIIPSSVESIGIEVFLNCNSLTKIEVDKNNLNYSSENGVLFNKDKTELIYYPEKKEGKTYIIPDTVTIIKSFAFKCASLTNIKIPNSVIEIESSAFDQSKIKSIVIPSSVNLIDEYVFAWCWDLETILIPDTIVSIKDSAFFFGANSIPSSLTIYCNENSHAEQYAKVKNINYETPIYAITNNLTNISSDGEDYTSPKLGNYTTTLISKDRYKLPDSVTIKVNGTILTADTDYTYNKENGSIVIPENKLTGDIEIIASAVKVPEYTVTINPVEGATITPNGVLKDILEGTCIDIAIKANEGYKIIAVKVNGVEQTLPLFEDILTILDIEEDINVVVEVEKEVLSREEIALRQIDFIGDSENQEFIIGTDRTLIFILDNDRGNGKVFVDGVELSEENGDYLWHFLEGIYPSIILSEDYMKTLKPGKYTIKFEVENVGGAETTFTVVEQEKGTDNIVNENSTNNPQTGDNILLFVGIWGISIIGILIATKFRKNYDK